MALAFKELLNKNKSIFFITIFLTVIIISSGVYWMIAPRTVPIVSGADPQKTLAITQVLDREKIPYTLQDGGGTVEVNQAVVETAKLKIYAADSSLAHEVGLEIFSTNDLGMTDFTQHVNLVRALQGELARTISSLPNINDARVHISIPEIAGSVRGRELHPKAAVTIHTKEDHSLSEDQVRSIQQLVSSSVPGLAISDVSVINGEGVSVASSSESTSGAAGRKTDESYLENKVRKIIKSTFKDKGDVSVAVAIAYSQQQKRTSKEQVLPSGSYYHGLPVGVLQTSRGAELSQEENLSSRPDQQGSVGKPAELTFSTGRQIENIEEGPAKITKLSASVIVSGTSHPLTANQYQQIVIDAMGMDPLRGDHVTVEIVPVEDASASGPLLPTAITEAPTPSLKPPAKVQQNGFSGLLLWFILGTISVFGLLYVWWQHKKTTPESLLQELRVLLGKFQ